MINILIGLFTLIFVSSQVDNNLNISLIEHLIGICIGLGFFKFGLESINE